MTHVTYTAKAAKADSVNRDNKVTPTQVATAVETILNRIKKIANDPVHQGTTIMLDPFAGYMFGNMSQAEKQQVINTLTSDPYGFVYTPGGDGDPREPMDYGISDAFHW